MRIAFLIFLFGFAALRAADPATADPYLWLEGVDDPKALAWVEAHNAATAKRLASPLHDALYRDALAVLDAASRLPEVTLRGSYAYNLWQDRAHPRGLYRRTTLAELQNPEPKWETVIDVDALAKAEGRPWAFNAANFLPPDYKRALIRLAPGGGDAVEVREFDLEKLAFVKDGFFLPTAKVRVAWRDADSLFVGTDFGPGSLTASGYPRIVKLWRRGTPLAEAQTLHEGDAKSVAMSARRLRSSRGNIDLVTEGLTFWTSRHWQIVEGKLVPLDLPPTANVVDVLRDWLVVHLKENWRRGEREFLSGSVLLVSPAAVRQDDRIESLVWALATPSESRVIRKVDVTDRGVLLGVLDNVRGRLVRTTLMVPGPDETREIPFADNGAIAVMTADEKSGNALVRYESFLTPPSLYLVREGSDVPQLIRSQGEAFDGSRFAVEQLWATSADGTKIPYFLVAPKNFKRDGTAPTWMFSYGGFENALTPSYSGSYETLHGAYGKLWLERGGVFVLANIRGGGEFGPQWHRSVLKENHVKCFEDFEAVARDLAVRKITSPKHLGIEGRSNGGLLVSATMLRHPELYGAVVCGNPLVDMQRYHRLLAGASWMAEYGNPDVPAEWDFISRYSPYQRMQPGMKLPPVLFYTSTRDDRVHPGHARKMAARMEEMGYPIDYYELVEGGHHGSVTNEQLATRLARTYTFLWQKLK